MWPCWYTGSGLLSLDLNDLLYTEPVQGSRVSFSTILQWERYTVETNVKARQERELPCARLKHHANKPSQLSLLLANVCCLDNSLDKLWNCCALIFESAFQLIGETTLLLPIRPKVAERSCTNCVEMYRLSLNAVCWMSNCCWIADYLNSRGNSVQCLIFKIISISWLKRNSLVCEGLGWEA